MRNARSGKSLQATLTHSTIAAVVLTYLASPGLYWSWLSHELEAGAFPVEADSLSIPFAGFLLLWLMGLPLILFTGLVIFEKLLKKGEEH